MKTNTPLLQLIRSMSPSEKRYFSIYAHQQGDAAHKQYLKLYLALESWPHPTLDEAAFKRLHRSKSFITHLNTHRRDLYELLLRVMRIYRAGQRPELKLSGMIQDIQLLIDKRLYEDALEIATEAIPRADTYEMFAERMQLNAFVRVLLAQPGLHTYYELQDIEENDLKQLQHLQMLMQADHCISHVMEYLQLPHQHRQETSVQPQVQLALRLYHLPRCPMRVQMKCFNALGMYYLHTARHAEMYNLCLEWMDRCHHNPHPLLHDPERVMKVYRNFLATCIYLEKWEDMPPVLELLAEMRHEEEHLKLQQQEFLLHSTLFYELNNPQHVNPQNTRQRFDKAIRQLKPHLNPLKLGHHLFNMGVLMQLHRQYQHSNHYLQQFLKHAAQQPSLHDLYVSTLLLQWINFYSLHQFDAADKQLRNTRLLLKKENLQADIPGQLTDQLALVQKNGKGALQHLSLQPETTPAPWSQLVGLLSSWLATAG